MTDRDGVTSRVSPVNLIGMMITVIILVTCVHYGFEHEKHEEVMLVAYICSAGFWLYAAIRAHLATLNEMVGSVNIANAIAASFAATGAMASTADGWQTVFDTVSHLA